MLHQPKVNLIWFFDRIAQILCLNIQNEETNTTYLVDLLCQSKETGKHLAFCKHYLEEQIKEDYPGRFLNKVEN